MGRIVQYEVSIPKSAQTDYTSFYPNSWQEEASKS
jgi:hypothetical protein